MNIEETLEIEIKDRKQHTEIITKEGNYYEFFNSKSNYPCMVIRNPLTKSWMGYVIIPKEHPLCNINYRTLENKGIKIKVHGNLSFSNGDVFGFDCGHPNDYYINDFFTPMMKMINDMSDIYEALFENVDLNGKVTYKTKEFAIKETNQMAEQFFEYRTYKKGGLE